MHVTGDSSNATMEGGETDGLIKWVTAGGQVVATGGTSSVAANFAENFIKDGARSVAQTYPAFHADTLLVPPELIPDINATVQNGAGRPIVQIAGNGPDGTAGFTAGDSVMYYNTGFSVLRVKEEPYLSPNFNTSIAQAALIAFNSAQVKHAELIKFGAEALARTDTSLKRMVTCVYAQEHCVAKHTWIAPNLKSAIS
jgi:hypothetical protein